MIKKFAIIAPAVLALGALLSTPAAAATGNNPNSVRSEIAQLDRQIDQARGLSNHQERQFANSINRLQQQYRNFARGGFNRSEIATLNRGIENLRTDLFHAKADSHRSDYRGDRHDDRRGDRGSRH